MRFLLVAHAEKRGLEHIDVSGTHHIGEQLQKKGQQKQANVHAVHIGIGGNHNIVVTQTLQAIFQIQSCQKQSQFLVLVNGTLFLDDVRRLAHQTEHGLCVGVARLRDGTGSGNTLRDEDGGLQPARIVGVEMVPAIAQLAVVQAHFLLQLLRLLLQIGNRRALLFGLLNLFQDDIRHLLVFVQVVVQQPANHLVHIVPDSLAARFHVIGSQFGLGLRVEQRVLDFHRHGGAHGVAHIAGLEVLLVEIAKGFHDGLAHGLLVRAPMDGVLAVYEGVVVLAIFAGGVHHGELKVLIVQIDRLIQAVAASLLVQQIQQTVFGIELLPVEVDGKPAVQIDIVPQQVFDVFGVPVEVDENSIVRQERGHGAVFLGGVLNRVFLYQFAFGKFRFFDFPVADALYQKTGG